jgi:hypothetical protein
MKLIDVLGREEPAYGNWVSGYIILSLAWFPWLF